MKAVQDPPITVIGHPSNSPIFCWFDFAFPPFPEARWGIFAQIHANAMRIFNEGSTSFFGTLISATPSDLG